jgi:hypothetical protein
MLDADRNHTIDGDGVPQSVPVCSRSERVSMPHNYLDMRIDAVYSKEQDEWTVQAWLWNADKAIAGKQWSGSSLGNLLNMARVFSIAWTQQVFGDQFPDAQPPDKRGWRQLSFKDIE